MCIAIYKKSGIKAPSNDILKRCFNKNPQGAGYMYVDKSIDKVIIRKGFMNFNEFINDYKSTIKNPFDIDIVYHFRISTQGGINKELCHPFPLVDNYDDMRKLNFKADCAIAHNGIIELTSERYYQGFGLQYGTRGASYNDTMTFIKDYLSLIIDNQNWYNDKNKCKLIEKLIGNSRLAILDKTGHCELIGNWILDDGIYYSNSCYKGTFNPDPTSWNKKSTSKTKAKKATIKKVSTKSNTNALVDMGAFETTADNYVKIKDIGVLNGETTKVLLNKFKGIEINSVVKDENAKILKLLCNLQKCPINIFKVSTCDSKPCYLIEKK